MAESLTQVRPSNIFVEIIKAFEDQGQCPMDFMLLRGSN